MAVRTYDEVYFFNFDSYEDLRLYEVGCQNATLRMVMVLLYAIYIYFITFMKVVENFI